MAVPPHQTAPHYQRRVIAAAVVATLAGTVSAILAEPAELATQFWIALLPIALFGLSHGGADPWILRRMAGAERGGMIGWLGAYAAVAGAFIGFLLWQPLIALTCFLLLSAWHFGRSDAPFQWRERHSPAIWLAGSMPIIGPMAGHPGQTGELFAWMLGYGEDTVIAVVEILGPLLLLLWILGFMLLWGMGKGTPTRRNAGAVELLTMAAAMFTLPPILAFTFYFCVVHSPRHFRDLLRARGQEQGGGTRGGWRFLVVQAAPATGLALVLGGLAWWWLAGRGEPIAIMADGVRVLFWGLAALTVPHVLVVERWWASNP